jgi:hypothetical protein
LTAAAIGRVSGAFTPDTGAAAILLR